MKTARALDSNRFSRRRALGLLAGLAAGFRPAAAQRPGPNIVLVLADDLGWHQLGCYGSDFYETPRLDQLAREGMRFTDAYAAAPVCSPTRAALMTGKHPARLRITDYIPGNPYPFARLAVQPMPPGLPLEERTLAELLHNAGYVCGHFGKWHLNKDKNYRPERPGDPASQGFDDVLTTLKPDFDADPESDPHNVARITDRAVEFIRENRELPFFCYVTHNSIHRPQFEREELVEKYRRKPSADPERGNNPAAGAMVETLDASVGRILDALDAASLRDNTMVIFCSDNGPLYGFQARKPFYGGKGDLYEGGIRTPLIVRWPGEVAAGGVSAVPVSSEDFFPTFAEITGQTAEAVDGVSLTPVLTASGDLGREALYWHYPHYHRLSTRDGAVDHPVRPHSAIREGRWKLIEWLEAAAENKPLHKVAELYDLEADPGESENLTGRSPDKARELLGKLRSWKERVGAVEMRLNPSFDPARAREKKASD